MLILPSRFDLPSQVSLLSWLLLGLMLLLFPIGVEAADTLSRSGLRQLQSQLPEQGDQPGLVASEFESEPQPEPESAPAPEAGPEPEPQAKATRQEDIQLPTGRLGEIMARGHLIVGVKTDYPPWGGIDKQTRKVGLEPDLAQNLADRLGVGLQLVGVSSANRLGKVEDGSIDLVIATMGDILKRRKIAGLLEPNYYASGANILVHKGIKVHDWGELRGRKVCLTDGAYFNRDLILRYLIHPVTYKGSRDAQLALEAGRCIGWAYDDTALARLHKDERWRDFHMPLQSILFAPWSIAVSRAEQGGVLARFVEDTIAEWHRTGYLLEREAAWGIPTSRFLTEQNQLFSQRDESGQLICRRGEDSLFPFACRNQKLLKEAGVDQGVDAEGLRGTLLRMGIDFLPLKDPFAGKVLLKGIGITILLSLVAMAGSLGFGLLMAVAHSHSPGPLRWLIDAINGVFRMTPPILNLYIVFFGIGSLVAANWGFTFNAMIVACVVFSLYAGASNATILTKAIEILLKQRHDSHVMQVLPEAIQLGFTGLVANSVNIVKAVGIASVIAVPELISAANTILTENGNTLEMMNFLLVFYFILVALFLLLLNSLKTLVAKWAAAKS